MKKLRGVICVLIAALSLSGCKAAGTEAPSTNELGGNISFNGELSGTLTVSCFDSMRYKSLLEAAAKAFKEKYPDVTVEVDAFSEMPEVKTMDQGDGKFLSVMSNEDNPQSKADYISKINTEIMSGKGADILAIDVIPYYKYVESGRLVDMSAFMEQDPDFDKSDYAENILDAVKYKDGQYIFPVEYSFDYFAYDSSLSDEAMESGIAAKDKFTYEELIALADNAFGENGETYMFGLTDSVEMQPSMFWELLNANYASFIDVENKEVSLTDGRFEQLLEEVKGYAADGYIKKSDGSKDSINMNSSVGSGGTMASGGLMPKALNERFFYKPYSIGNLLQYFNKDSGFLMMTASAGNSDDDAIAGMKAGDDGSVGFEYTQAYGINANSQNQQLAWEFIKFLADTSVKNTMSANGIPVNTKALEEKTKAQISGEFLQNMQGGDFSAPSAGGGAKMSNDRAVQGEGPLTKSEEEQKQIFDDYWSYVSKFTSLINSYTIQDETINTMIKTEAKGFFDGSKTAKQVAEALQNRIELYINE